MSFLFPAVLSIGLPLVLAPILIHLLNLHRQKRVEWAAMEFLLQSDQQNRRWVNLREWLLMAARVLAVALAAAMLAGPQIAGRLAELFAGESTHHVLILDDSFSMRARVGDGSVWDELKGVARDILKAASRSDRSRLSVILSSSPDAATETATGREQLATFGERLSLLAPSESAADLAAALATASELAKETSAAGPVVAYVVSDFRQRNLEPAGRFKEPLRLLSESADAVRLAACASGPLDNAAVTSLRLLPGPRVANLEVTVDGVALPAATLGSVPPRESRATTFPVRFDGAGNHKLEVQLDSDALELDNRRLFAIRAPEERRLLVVDGSAGGAEGLVFTAALRPGGVATGWRPERVPTNRLEEAPLDDYDAVLMLDVPDASEQTAALLADYASTGGGLLLMLGPSADRGFYNRALLSGSEQPVLPIELGKPTQAPGVGRFAEQPDGDLAVAKHTIFRVFEGDRNSFLGLLSVNYYRSADLPSESRRQPNVLATLRGEAPLLIDSAEPNRRVLCLLTTVARPKRAAEGWSNLGASPVFPVLANELAAHLTELRTSPPTVVVGNRWSETRPATPKAAVARQGDAAGPQPIDDKARATGVGYHVLLESAAGGPGELVAVNVDAAEGDLAGPAPEELTQFVADLDVSVDTPTQFRRAAEEEQSSDAGRLLAGLLLTVLVGEKLLAVQASYHSSSKGGAA